MPTTIPLSKAKSGLSAIVRNVDETGAEYLVTVRGRPAALIAPVPEPTPKRPRAFGILKGMRPIASPEDEQQAWAEAMEAKHADGPRR